MKREAVEHYSSSRFCFPLDEHTYLIRIKVAKDDDITNVHLLYNEWFYFSKKQIDVLMNRRYEDDLFAYYETTITGKSSTFEYFFRFDYGDDEHIDYSPSGFHEHFPFLEAWADEFFATFINKSDLVTLNPVFNGGIIYQIFPERFNIGDKNKDLSYASIIEKDTDNAISSDKFYGGDLLGVVNKLDYLSSIGVEAIYLTPIHPSRSAHKYDVEDYFKIDPHFGSDDDFHRLVDEAHKRNIKIIMDMVFNHASFYSNLFQDVVRNGKNSRYYDWFFVDGEYPDINNGNYLMFANCIKSMPKLNTNNKEVKRYFIDVVSYWAKEFNVDGFRLDVSYEVSHEFWISLKLVLKEINPNIIFIGEYWLNSEAYLSSHEWDSVMNYPFLLAVKRFFDRGSDFKFLKEELTKVYLRYPNNINLNMANLLDSHDILRFYTYLNKDFDKYLTSLAILITYPGMPEIYYGDEICLEGKHDPDNRRVMKWDSEAFDERFNLIKQLLLLRKDDILRRGDVDFSNSIDSFILKRSYNNSSISLIISLKEIDDLDLSKDSILFSYIGLEHPSLFKVYIIKE